MSNPILWHDYRSAGIALADARADLQETFFSLNLIEESDVEELINKMHVELCYIKESIARHRKLHYVK